MTKRCGVEVEADDSGLLIDAADYYRAVYRACSEARRSIAISGWQLDSKVPLLRGADAEGAALPVELLPFLEALVARNEALEIYILAWDFSALYTLERELFQRIKFGWTTSSRIHFHFDDLHPFGASHHQKIVVIDRSVGFSGGMDLCDHRWDDRAHRADNPHRVTIDGRAYEPYHDVQAFVTGRAADALAQKLEARWKRATGDELRLAASDTSPDTSPDTSFDIEPTIRLGPAVVALTETRGAVPPHHVDQCEEIAEKYERAIAAATKLIYIENQYYTADRVQAALEARLGERGKPALDVVLILPKKASALKEIIALGVRQAKLLNRLADAVEGNEHRLGIYYSSPTAGPESATYIHSKVLIVDDVHLTVGSANTTNRSMGVDTELDLDWESPTLETRIRGVRYALLREHVGRDDFEAPLGEVVARLDEVCGAQGSKLVRFPIDDIGILSDQLDADEVPDVALDPAKPIFLEALRVIEPDRDASFVARSVQWLVDKALP